MAHVLPARPNLAYLKKLAKQRLRALRAGGATTRLAEVQRALAREYGVPSWRALVDAVRQARGDEKVGMIRVEPDAHLLAALFRAALPAAADHSGGRMDEAQTLLQQHPALGEANIYTAAVAGRVARMRELLAQDATLAVTAGGPLGWLPLSYLCFSRLLRFDAARRGDFLQCAKALLAAGADPNTFFINEGDQVKEAALYGATGLANDPALTKLLLDAGADVNDGESLYHAAEHADHACLKLLLERRPRPAWVSYCMGHKMDYEDPAGVALFLKYGADPNYLVEGGALQGYRPLHVAIRRNRGVKVVAALLDAGADPQIPMADGTTAYAFARRMGRTEIARYLLKHGAKDELTEEQRFLAAVTAGNEATARRMLRTRPDLLDQLRPEDHRLLVDAAGIGNGRAVKLMLALGFPLEMRGDWKGTALHHAAWQGRTTVVKLLLRQGADVTAKNQWGGDVLATAIHGATEGGHSKGAAIVELVAAKMPGATWEKYLEQAREAGNAAVIDALERRTKVSAKGAAAAPAQQSTAPAPAQQRAAHPAPLLQTKRQSKWPDSYALIERRNATPGRGGGWRPAGLTAEVLGTQAAVAHIRKAGKFADYRRITVWVVVKVHDGAATAVRSKLRPPFDLLEKYTQSSAEKPRGGPWERIAWPPGGQKPTPQEAVDYLARHGEAGIYRVITVTRMFRALPGKERMVVRTGHVSNPDEDDWPTLQPKG